MGKALIIKNADFSLNGMPSEFVRLSWIGGSTANESFINSGVFWGNKVSSFNDEMEFCVQLDATDLVTDNFRSMGAKINDYTNCNVWFTQSDTGYFFGNVKGSTGASSFDGEWHTIKLSKNGCVYDGTLHAFTKNTVTNETQTEPTIYTGTSPAPSAVYGDIPIYIDCASNRANTSTKNLYIDGPSSAMKIAWVKYRRNGTLILDAIPVKRKSDDKICFYDRVTGAYMGKNDNTNPTYSL